MHTIVGAILFSIFITSLCALLITLFKFENIAKYAVIALSGSIMIAHGTRMITQTLFYPNSCYKPGLFDLMFDWLTLTLLGIFVAQYGFSKFYTQEKEKYSKKHD